MIELFTSKSSESLIIHWGSDLCSVFDSPKELTEIDLNAIKASKLDITKSSFKLHSTYIDNKDFKEKIKEMYPEYFI